MRFMFSSTRGTGHLQPLLPYARVLKARGHEVIVAAPEEVAELLRHAGLEHCPFDHPGAQGLGPIWARLSGASEQEALTIAIREIFAGLSAQVALPKLTQAIASWRPDLIVRDSVEFAALVAAERAGLPHVRVAVHATCFEDDVVLGQVDGPLTVLRAAVGLPPDERASLLREPVFCAFPASWDSAASAGAGTLAPFRARMPEDAGPTDLGAWRPAGDPALPLVYLTFGTIVGSIARIRFVYRLALDAVAELPVRAVLTTGPGIEAEALGLIPSNVEVKAWIPQREVLAHAAAVVCHGGSGTLRGALAAGLPLVVLPFGADQPFNARRIAAVRAGLALEDPDVTALRAAVQRVLTDADLRTGAQNMAAEIAALPSLEQAVDALIALARRPLEAA